MIRKTGLSFTEPQGAYYVMVDMSPLGFETDMEAAEWLVLEIGVASVSGSSFFREHEHRYVRFHFAKKEGRSSPQGRSWRGSRPGGEGVGAEREQTSTSLGIEV